MAMSSATVKAGAHGMGRRKVAHTIMTPTATKDSLSVTTELGNDRVSNSQAITRLRAADTTATDQREREESFVVVLTYCT